MSFIEKYGEVRNVRSVVTCILLFVSFIISFGKSLEDHLKIKIRPKGEAIRCISKSNT